MPWIHELLDATSPTQIAEVHARWLGRAGIVQSSKLRSELENWLADTSRLDSLEEEERSHLEKLSFAGPSGLAEPRDAWEGLAQKFLAFRSEEASGWHPLREWSREFRGRYLDSHRVARDTSAIPDRLSSPRAWIEGLAALSARLDLGAGRLTRTGEINRRDRPRLRESFFHLDEFGPEAQDLCLDLSLAYLTEKTRLCRRASLLEVQPDWISDLDHPEDLSRSIETWWVEKTFADQRDWWDQVRVCSLGAEAAREIWNAFEDKSSSGPVLWPSLPLHLREAIALGLLDARTEAGRLVQIAPPLPDLDAPDRATTTTADLLIYLAPMAPSRLRRGLESMAVRESAGIVSRYRFTRECVLEAAAHPRLGKELPAILDELAPPDNVRRVVKEWLEARLMCHFETLRVLRVRDPQRMTELSALPAVAGLIRESIPGWGFVVDATNEAPLRQVLQTLGYEPPDPPVGEPSPAEPWNPLPKVEIPEALHWILTPPAEELRRTAISAHSKYGEVLKELPFQDMMRVMEYAILTETEVEVVLKGATGKAQRLRVLRIDKRKEPVSIEIRSPAGREDRELAMDQIRKIRLC